MFHLIKKCVDCQSLKADHQKPAGKMQQPTVKGSNEMLGIDLMGPLPRSPERKKRKRVVLDKVLKRNQFLLRQLIHCV